MEPLPIRNTSNIDLLIVPGIAFDRMGHRLGYGRGYFDRYLSQAKPHFSIGLAYNFQMVESLPHYSHDQKLDAIATESEIIYT
jgi:5-formyltetrahydrofolate cyclo-ligase